ncbi:MAG: response regulator transcription factor [Flavobacteriaceae bacterium]|nr:response regulator transcription factor [Flavobacteriaceae bacterium]
MKVVIVEDEPLAAEKLERYLVKHNATTEILETLPSISKAVSWFQNNQDYDIVFMDIQLTDGLSFEIFNQVQILKPIVFTTAFDEYAIDAFKVNSVDYILKPITFTDLSNAMKKLQKLQNVFGANEHVTKAVQQLSDSKTKDRFLVRLGNHIHSIKTEEIALFYAEGRTVYLITNEKKKYILDYKLESLENVLESSVFFRVNRTFIVNISSIADVLVYSNSRLKISSDVYQEKEIIVSREKVTAFKSWFEGN